MKWTIAQVAIASLAITQVRCASTEVRKTPTVRGIALKTLDVTLDANCQPFITGPTEVGKTAGHFLALDLSRGSCTKDVAVQVCAFSPEKADYVPWEKCSDLPHGKNPMLADPFVLDGTYPTAGALCSIAAPPKEDFGVRICVAAEPVTDANVPTPACKKFDGADMPSCVNGYDGAELAMEVDP